MDTNPRYLVVKRVTADNAPFGCKLNVSAYLHAEDKKRPRQPEQIGGKSITVHSSVGELDQPLWFVIPPIRHGPKQTVTEATIKFKVKESGRLGPIPEGEDKINLRYQFNLYGINEGYLDLPLSSECPLISAKNQVNSGKIWFSVFDVIEENTMEFTVSEEMRRRKNKEILSQYRRPRFDDDPNLPGCSTAPDQSSTDGNQLDNSSNIEEGLENGADLYDFSNADYESDEDGFPRLRGYVDSPRPPAPIHVFSLYTDEPIIANAVYSTSELDEVQMGNPHSGK